MDKLEYLISEMKKRVPGRESYYISGTRASYSPNRELSQYYLAIDDESSGTLLFSDALKWIKERENDAYRSNKYKKDNEILFRKF